MSGSRRDPGAMLLRGGLRVCAAAYGVGVRLRNRKFDRKPGEICRAEVPVISIGNITAGGTGKTPMVAWAARVLRDEGLRVAIISRGYGAGESGVNDEALELEQRLPDVPHVQNPDRVAAAQTVVDELETQVILLDDGFQHRRLHRDLNIVLIDATCPFGYGHLLPRGLLREPLSGLRRADAIVLSRSDAVDKMQLDEIRESVRRCAANAIIAEAIHAPAGLITCDSVDIGDARTLAGLNVLLVSAIGNPAAFEKTVADCGANVIACKTFADHHRFDRDDITAIADWARAYPDAKQIVCTHKDLVKLKTDRIGGLPLVALSIEMQITQGEPSLRQAIIAAATGSET